MRRSICFICALFTLVLHACVNAQSDFPDVIDVKITSDFKRVKGTKFFTKIPQNYTPMEELARLQKDNDTYLQVLELPDTDFISKKQAFTRESIEKKGAEVTVHKPIRYNGYDAIYLEGPSKKAGETKLSVIFGDESFVVMVLGVCNDENGKDELKAIIENSTYDKDFNLEPLELASFTFDEKITGFKFATSASNFFIYTADGGPIEVNGILQSNFTLSSLPIMTFSKAKEFLNDIYSRQEREWKNIHNIKKTETVINGREAYEITFDVKVNSQYVYVYEVVMVNETSAFVFMGSDYDNKKYIERFVRTASALEMKK